MSKLKKYLLTIHIIYWSIILPIRFYLHTWPWYTGEDPLFWYGALYSYSLILGYFYFHYSVLVPRFLLQGKYIVYGVILPICMVVYAFLSLTAWNFHHTIQLEFHYEASHLDPLLAVAVSPALMASALKIFENWVKTEYEKNALEKVNAQSRIDFLKSQINPHFIFNTLNNIYSLSLTDTQLTQEALAKLEGTFSYLKKVEHQTTVTLKEEVAYLENFIALCKLRLVHPEKIEMTLDISDDTNEVYPMLMIPFLENAFKHGSLNNPLDFIKIELKSDDIGVTLNISNTVMASNNSKDRHRGIGIANVEERLALFFSKENYRLTHTTQNNIYLSQLNMPYANS